MLFRETVLNGQLHALAALPPRKEPLVAIGQEVKWALEPVWMTWRRENSWPYRDLNSDPSFIQPVASRYADYAVKLIEFRFQPITKSLRKLDSPNLNERRGRWSCLCA
jgi:hypothetical protein